MGVSRRDECDANAFQGKVLKGGQGRTADYTDGGGGNWGLSL